VRDGLLSCAKAICNDVVFRRALRYRPQETLASIGLEPERVPATLPVRHYEIVAEITEPVLFGPQSTAPSANSAWPVEFAIGSIRAEADGTDPHGCIGSMSTVARVQRTFSLRAALAPLFRCLRRPRGGRLCQCRRELACGIVDSSGLAGLLVARDWRQVQLGWLSMLFHWDEFLGLLLGYPECCVAAFPKNWESACAHSMEKSARFCWRATATRRLTPRIAA